MTGAGEDVQIRLAETDAEIAACFAVMHELRPMLAASEFVERVRRQMSEGYRLARLDAEGAVATVAGFRVNEKLHGGRTMYVDDLVTAAAARSCGHGHAMLGWLIARARAEGCTNFALDSGTHRTEAHAFYLRERLRITSFHFQLPL